MTDVHQRLRVAADDRPTPTQEGRIVSSMHRAANLSRSRRALVLMLVASFAAIITRPASATPPVPFYASRVTEIDRQSRVRFSSRPRTRWPRCAPGTG